MTNGALKTKGGTAVGAGAVGALSEAQTKSLVDGYVSSTNQPFCDAVLAVGLNIDTNSVAVLNEIAATFGGFPIAGTSTTVGGLLADLAAAVALLRKKTKLLKSDGTAEYDFATNLLGKPVAINAIHDNGGVQHDTNGYFVNIEE